MTTDVAGFAAGRARGADQAGNVAGGFLRRMPEWLVAVGVGVFAVLAFSIPFWLHPFFYYIGDNPESFVPLWHHFGQQILSGHWPTMEAIGWYGGNYAGEAARTWMTAFSDSDDVAVSPIYGWVSSRTRNRSVASSTATVAANA